MGDRHFTAKVQQTVVRRFQQHTNNNKNSSSKNNTQSKQSQQHVYQSISTALHCTYPGNLQDDGTVSHFSVKHYSQGSWWNCHLPKYKKMSMSSLCC